MSTVAAIDCGTNTIKLLIGDLPQVAVREMRMVRLGQDLDRTGRLAPEALDRAFAALDEYAALIAAHGVSRIRFCATSATRDASNAEEFVAGVRERLGVTPEVITGTEEAALSYAGALRHLMTSPNPPQPPVLVLDIGGGSTELILGGAEAPERACSLDIGSVRLHERHLHSDPPSPAEVAACVADIEAQLAGCPVDPGAAATVVGVAGTITTVAAGVLDLPRYDRDLLDRAVIGVAEVQDFVGRLIAMPIAHRRDLPYLHPGRVDVIGAGALILSRVLQRVTTTSLTVSEADILDGIAWSIAH